MTEKIILLDAKVDEKLIESNLYLVSLRYPDGEELIDVEFSGTDIACNLYITERWSDPDGLWQKALNNYCYKECGGK